MADRRISFDLIAFDKASEALAKVGRQVTQLGEKIRTAGGSVKIDADTARAREQIAAVEAQLGRLSARRLKIDADTEDAERKLQTLRAELARTDDNDAKIRITADITQVERELTRLKADRTSVDLDTTAAQAKLVRLRAEAKEALGSGRERLQVDADVSGAVNGLAKIAALLASIIPLAGAAAGAIAGVGAVGIAGIGAAVAGFVGIGDAIKAMGDKATSGGAAVKVSAEAIRSAQRGVEQANRDLIASHRDVTSAELDLTRARQDAIRTLEDYRMRSEGMALSQQDASLAVREAEARLNDVLKDGTSTGLERERAALSLAQARQREKDLTVESTRLTEDKTAADAKGVEGSDQVTSAKQRLTDAQERATLATQKLADAQLHLQETMNPPGGGGGGGVDKLAEAMGKLGPKAQEFVKFMREFIDGPLTKLRQAGQEAFLPGIQSGLERLKPLMAQITPAWASFSGTLGKALGDIMVIAGKLAAPFLRFADAALKGLAPLGDVLANFATQFGQVLDRLASSGVIEDVMWGVVQVFGALLPLLPKLVEVGAKLAVQVFPLLAQILLQLGPLLIAMVEALGPLLVQALTALLPLITQLTQYLVAHPEIIQAVVVAALALGAALGPIASIIEFLVPLFASLSGPVLIVVGAVAALAAGIIYAWQHSETFRAKVQELWEALKKAWDQISTAVMPGLRELGDTIRTQLLPALGSFVEAIAPIITWLVEKLGPVVGIVFSGMIEHIKGAVSIISGIINVFTGILTGDWQRSWDGIKQIVSGAFTIIASSIKTAGQTITALAPSLWEGLKNAFRSVMNWIIGGWNSLHFNIPSFDFAGQHFGGGSVGVQHITPLATGGIVTSPTLALIGEAGREAVIPLDRGPGLGGNTYQFHFHGVMAGDEQSFARTVLNAIIAGVNSGQLPRTLLPA